MVTLVGDPYMFAESFEGPLTGAMMYIAASTPPRFELPSRELPPGWSPTRGGRGPSTGMRGFPRWRTRQLRWSTWQTRIEAAGICRRLIFGGVDSPWFPWARQNVIAATTLLSKLFEAETSSERRTHRDI